jgi:HAD superfamily hydrolase (TIGR01509 family)
MNKTNKKTYLFDFDGTLVDSMPTFVSVMLRILDEHGIKYGDDIVKIITPLGYHGTAEYYRTLGIDLPTDKLVEIMNEYAEHEYVYNILAKDTVIETLNELKKRGYSLNVLTASPHIMLDPCLKRLGVWDLFDNVWSCDDFSTTKSNPKIYQLAAEKLGVKVEDVIFVDDNVNAVKTAKVAGMQSYGIYDDSSKDYEDEMRKVCDHYVKWLSELLGI